MDIREFGEKFIAAEDEAWQNGNFDPLEALETPDVAYHVPPTQETRGWAAHKEHIQGSRQAVSDIHQEWEYITGDGNVFSLSFKSRGLFTGEIPGMPPPTGKEVTSDYLFVFRLENGRIAEAWARGSNTM